MSTYHTSAASVLGQIGLLEPMSQLASRTWDVIVEARDTMPMEDVYLCGACTHPGGGVVAINGRNAAMEILGV